MAIIFKPRRSDRSKVSSGGTKATLVLEQGELFFVKNDTSGSTGRYNIYMGDGSTQIQSLSPALFGDTSEEDITLTTDSSTTSAAALANITSGKTLGSLLGSIKTAISLLKSETALTFHNGDSSHTNQFGVKIGSNSSTVTITPYIANNITGTGTNNYIPKFNGNNSLSTLAAIGSDTTKYLRNDGTWAVPANNNDKVNQSSTTTSNWRKVIVGYQDSATPGAAVTNVTNVVYTTPNFEFQPSTGTMNANKLKVNQKVTLEYNSTTECLDLIFS